MFSYKMKKVFVLYYIRMDLTLIIIFILVVIILYFVFNKVTSGDGITGLLDATKKVFIPNKDMGITTDDKKITDYSFSIWTYLNNWSYNYGQQKTIFKKEGLEVFYAPTQNDLVVKIDTFDPADSQMNTVEFECAVSNIPIQKWIHTVVSIHGKTIDIYINGKLVKTCVMQNVPKYKQGTGVEMTSNGGFAGYTSKFKYVNNVVDPQTVWSMYKKGWNESNILSPTSYDVDLVVSKNGEVVF
jgi:hypothetical protein